MTTKSYPAQPPRVPKLVQLAVVVHAANLPDAVYGLDTEGRAWRRTMEPGALWRRVPDACDPRDR